MEACAIILCWLSCCQFVPYSRVPIVKYLLRGQLRQQAVCWLRLFLLSYTMYSTGTTITAYPNHTSPAEGSGYDVQGSQGIPGIAMRSRVTTGT